MNPRSMHCKRRVLIHVRSCGHGILHRYASVEASAKVAVDVPLPACWSQIEVENWLMVHAAAVNAGKPVHVGVDVFEQGFDRSVPLVRVTRSGLC